MLVESLLFSFYARDLTRPLISSLDERSTFRTGTKVCPGGF
jgi:hypothetical protein